jgi:hypothetical protein
LDWLTDNAVITTGIAHQRICNPLRISDWLEQVAAFIA